MLKLLLSSLRFCGVRHLDELHDMIGFYDLQKKEKKGLGFFFRFNDSCKQMAIERYCCCSCWL